MKTYIKAITLTLVIGFSFGFQVKLLEPKDINLAAAVEKKAIKVILESTGSYQGASIRAKLKNTTAQALRIRIPAGSYFEAVTDGEQNLVTTQDILVLVPAQKEIVKVVDGFCCNASKKCPQKEHFFRLSNKKLPKMDQLTTYLKGKKFENHVYQDAVWTLSDQRPISNISGENNEDVKALRNELAKITGMENNWYTSPQQRSVDPYGNINRETVAIEGMVSFNCPPHASVHQEIQDSEGKMVAKTSNKTKLEAGPVKYGFRAQVKGWKKGKYSLKLMNGTQVLYSTDFEV